MILTDAHEGGRHKRTRRTCRISGVGVELVVSSSCRTCRIHGRRRTRSSGLTAGKRGTRFTTGNGKRGTENGEPTREQEHYGNRLRGTETGTSTTRECAGYLRAKRRTGCGHRGNGNTGDTQLHTHGTWRQQQQPRGQGARPEDGQTQGVAGEEPEAERRGGSRRSRGRGATEGGRSWPQEELDSEHGSRGGRRQGSSGTGGRGEKGGAGRGSRRRERGPAALRWMGRSGMRDRRGSMGGAVGGRRGRQGADARVRTSAREGAGRREESSSGSGGGEEEEEAGREPAGAGEGGWRW